MDISKGNLAYKELFNSSKIYEMASLSPRDSSNIKERLLSQMTYVKVSFSRTSYPIMAKGLRATNSDKISMIGGTLGLFTGISFVSIVEILFWIGKAIAKNCIGGRAERGHLRIDRSKRRNRLRW